MRPPRPSPIADSSAAFAFDGFDDGLLVLDADDGILSWSPAFARAWSLFGVPLVRSLTFAENLEAAAEIGRSGDAAETWLAHRRDAAGTATPCLLALPGGLALRIMETAITPKRRIITCRDVSAERQRENALRDSEYRYRLLVETITEGLIVLDRERRIVYANPRFLSWYGSGDMEFLGRPLADLTAPAERERLESLFSATAPRAVEIPLACADGAVRFALISAAPLRAAEGGISGHFAVITDVTDLRRANERLRDSEGRFRSIIESTPFGILTLDGAGCILSANPAFRAIAGAGFGEGERAEVRLPEALPPIAEMMTRLAREPELRTVDGESRIVRDGRDPGHARLLLSRMGEDGGFLMVVEDVTERRRMEEVLRHASKLALLGEMSASLAHEISQPLNVIRLAAESALLSLADGDAATMRDKFEIIGAQSDRLRETIDYMQGFSRRDAGPRRCFDLKDAVEAALGLVLPQCANRGIAVVRNLPEAALPVLGHARQAEQVLINLLNNAVDAIAERRAAHPGGADHILLSARLETPRGGAAEIRLEIADTGTGIRPEDMPHLFDPFFTRKTEGAGTGLGLSISLGLVTAMGGRIEVENRPEGGCRFRVVLPACLDTPVEAAPNPAAPKPVPAAGETPSMAILVVDDEDLATREIAAFLEKSGHAAFTAASGRQAREVLADTHIDILITDLRMPDGDGFQLIAEAAAEYPQIGLVVMTGQPLRDREALAELENGVDAILRKPVSLRELAETLRSLA